MSSPWGKWVISILSFNASTSAPSPVFSVSCLREFQVDIVVHELVNDSLERIFDFGFWDEIYLLKPLCSLSFSFFFPWFCCCFLGGTLPWTLYFICHSVFCLWSCISILVGYSFFVVIYKVERKKCNARLFIDSKWLFLIIHHIILQHIRTYRKNFKSTVQTSLVWCSHGMRWKT